MKKGLLFIFLCICFCLTGCSLEDAYRRARNGHMRYMEELGVI